MRDITIPAATSNEVGEKVRVTVGVCVRNCEDTIESVVDCILGQDYCHKNTEVIIVDDGSEDRTLELVRRSLEGTDVRVRIFSSVWRGLGPSRNTVVKNAQGDYIVWVDGDMILPRDFLRKQVEFMEKRPEVAIGKGQYRMYKGTGLVAELENLEGVMDIMDYREKGRPIPLGTGGSIYRTEALRQIGGFDEGIKGVGEDYDAEHRLRTAGWLLQISPATFYEMRRRTWKALWDEYFWHGSGGHTALRRIRQSRPVVVKMFPAAAILIELAHSCAAYRLTHKKMVFLLPIHWIFKRMAWCLGLALSCIKEQRLKIHSQVDDGEVPT